MLHYAVCCISKHYRLKQIICRKPEGQGKGRGLKLPVWFLEAPTELELSTTVYGKLPNWGSPIPTSKVLCHLLIFRSLVMPLNTVTSHYNWHFRCNTNLFQYTDFKNCLSLLSECVWIYFTCYESWIFWEYRILPQDVAVSFTDWRMTCRKCNLPFFISNWFIYLGVSILVVEYKLLDFIQGISF